MESILTSIKKLLGPEEDNTQFDDDIIIFINWAIMRLNQLGIGPDGYKISSKVNTWNEFFGDRTDLELVKIAVYLRVRLLFDPPQNAFLVTAIKEQIAEYDWRIELNHKPIAP